LADWLASGDWADCSFSLLQEHIPAALAAPFQPVWFLTLNRKRASAGFRRVATANHDCRSGKRNFNARIAKSTVRWGKMLEMLEIRAAAPILAFEGTKATDYLRKTIPHSFTKSQPRKPSSRAVHVADEGPSGGMAAIRRPLCSTETVSAAHDLAAVHPIFPYDQPNP
jgi:hypothetical protein